MIRAAGLSKRFGDVVAVDHIDLDIQGHGIVGFLGPNGAGKTTTMRLLSGVLAATAGTARIDGIDVFDDPISVKARVGYLPETPPLYPELTVGEYLDFVAQMRGVPSGARWTRVGAAMERVGLSGWERRLLGDLSKGYRQRVGLAQAIVHDPPLLILDVPTAGLDPAQLPAIRRLIQELAAERLVVLSTHILPEVEALCGRVVLIHKGRIAGDGTVSSLAAAQGRAPFLAVTIDGAGDDATSRLASLPSTLNVDRLDARTFHVQGGADLADEVAKMAVAQGWRMVALERRSATLEDVFLSLVGGEA